MKCNYHTHTYRCQHAVGKDEDYVRAALDAGFDTLGFADHAPWPYSSGYVSNIRMPMSELPGYVASLRALREKYQGQLDIHIGLESEYFPRYKDHLHRLLDSGNVEYLILGAHYTDSDECTPYAPPLCTTADGVKRYVDNCVAAMETGLFRYIAHPDLYLYPRADAQFDAVCQDAARDICLTAKAHNMPIEYNLQGLSCELKGESRGYPSHAFWEYVKPYAGDVIIGVDAHDPAHLTNTVTWNEAEKRLHAMGYTPLESLTL